MRRKVTRYKGKRVVDYGIIPTGEKEKEPSDWVKGAIRGIEQLKRDGNIDDNLGRMESVIKRMPLIACFFLPIAYVFVKAWANIIKSESGRKGILDVF